MSTLLSLVRNCNYLFCYLSNTHLFLGEVTNKQDPVKCSGVGCENPLHRWYVVEVISVFATIHQPLCQLFYCIMQIMTYSRFIFLT